MSEQNMPRMSFVALFFVATLSATPAGSQTFEPLPAKDGYSYPESYCSNRGHRVEMGGLSCLRVDGRVFLARCAMSLNVPVWRTIQDSCPPGIDTVSDANPAAVPGSSRESNSD